MNMHADLLLITVGWGGRAVQGCQILRHPLHLASALMSQSSPSQVPVKPLLTVEQMERILSSRRSITSEEAYKQMAAHMGRPLSPGRKKTFVNGREVWVCC